MSVPDPDYLGMVKGNYYDFLTMLSRYGDDKGLADRSKSEFAFLFQAQAHESTHWRQHIATSIGIFLSFVNFNQQVNISRFLTFDQKRYKSLLFQRRVHQRPIVPIDKETYYLSVPEGDPDLDANNQILYDSWFLWNFFYNARTLTRATLYKSPKDIISLALRDTITRINNFQGYEHSSLPEFIKLIDTGEMLTSSELESYSELTTYDILEASASANEIIYLHVSNFDRQELLARLYSLLGSSYGKAFVSFIGIMQIKNDDLFHFLPNSLFLFQLLCDIALNPPLPPVVVSDTYSWSDIYPPIRFMRLLKASRGFLVLLTHDDITSHSRLTEISDTLCRLAGLTSISTYIYPEFSSNTPEFEDAIFPMFSRKTQIDLSKCTDLYLRNSFLFAGQHYFQRNGWLERKENLPKLVFPGYLTGLTSRLDKQKDVSVVMPIEFFKPGLYVPPLQTRHDKGELVVPDGIDVNFGTWLGLVSFKEHLLRQIVFKSGEPKLGMFPENHIQVTGILSALTLEFTADFGEPPW